MRRGAVSVLALAVVLAAVSPAVAAESVQRRPDFLGLFAATEVRRPLAEQLDSLGKLFDGNPHLRGLSIRATWREIEPADGRFDWAPLDRVVAFARARKVLLTIDPIAAKYTPRWVYVRGAKEFQSIDVNPYHPTHGQTITAPVPWDATYRTLWRRLLTELAARYGAEPSLVSVTVHGHNHTAEMHMPRRPEDMTAWGRLGWSVELVERDWKDWIDFYAQTFPRPRIGLVLSPMYGRSTSEVVERLAAHAAGKYRDRVVLMTAVLAGRGDMRDMLAIRSILAHPEVLNAHETVSAFERDPARQGSLEMSVYNMRQLSPLFLRLWRIDAADAALSARILAEYERARKMTLAEYRQELESRNLFSSERRRRPGVGGSGQRPAKRPGPSPSATPIDAQGVMKQ